MGREQKAGVDYFSHDVGAHNRKTLSALRQRWGNDGYAFWYILLEILGEQANLSLDCRKKINWVYLCTETRVDEISAAEILGFLSEIEAIDENLWKKHKIIWCQGFADRLKDVYKKRVRQPQKTVVEDEEISAKPVTEQVPAVLPNNTEEISATETTATDEFPQISAAESTQTKLNYTKQNKTKEQYSTNYVSSTRKLGAKKTETADIKSCFVMFWTKYPKKCHISEAKAAFCRLVELGIDADEIVTAACKYALEKARTDTRYCKKPEDFLTVDFIMPYLPKFSAHCQLCNGNGIVFDGDTAYECQCANRYKGLTGG